MKRILLLIAILTSSVVHAQSDFFRNDGNLNINRQDQAKGYGAVDARGNVYVKSTDPSTNLSESIIGASSAAGVGGSVSVLTGSILWSNDTVEVGSTTTVINATAHAASVGDTIIIRTGPSANLQAWSTVSAVTANTITLAYPLPATPVAADAFQIRKQVPLSSTLNTVSSYNSLMCSIDADGQVAAATGILKREDAAHASTDAGVMSLNVANDTASNLAADGDYVPQAAHITGAGIMNIWEPAVPAANRGRSILKQEDVTHVTGDSGIMMLGIRNDGASALTGTDLDYTTPVVNQYGGTVMDLDIRFQGNGTPSRSPIRAEDAVSASQDTLMSAGAIVRSDVAANAADADYANINVDLDGRLYVNATGSGVSDYINGCSASAVTTNTTQTLVAADADERFYVTGFSCENTGGAATRVILEDGAGTDLEGCMLAATTGQCVKNIGAVPIRLANTNSLLQINVLTTGTSTTCCVRGYKSPN